MLNYIFAQRNAYGVAQRKIAQIFKQEGGPSLEDFLQEEECLINQISAQNPKLIEFLCQRDTLRQLVEYATKMPGDPENRDKAYKYPFVCSNVLNSSNDICKYLLEGGMPQEEAEPEEEDLRPTQETLNKDSDSEEATASDSKITEKTEETAAETKESSSTSEEFKEEAGDLNNQVAESLAKDKAAQDKSGEKETTEQLVEELDQDFTEDDSEDKKSGSESGGLTQVSLKPALNKDDEENKSSENVEPETDSKGDPIRVGVVVPQARKFGNDEDKAETEDEDATANTEFKPKNDYTLMDELMEFLEVPEERADNENRLEPILCGYFNKIMQALLQKQKGKTMEYLLLVAKGKIFDNLLCHMQHYSLASLMLHFLGMKFFLEDYSGYNNVAQQRTSLLDWDNNSDSDESENKPRTNNERTEAAAAETEARFNEMQALFDRKRHMVVKTLLGYLSKRNPDNLEKTLNANTVLQECVENEMTFKLLVNEGHLEYIINICCEGNANKQNAPYIKHLLGNIIQQYCLRTRNFFDVKISDFKSIFADQFTDLVYSLCLTLRQADTANDGFDTYKNQARVEIRKIGLDRIRSMELLKQCFALLQKHFPNPNAQANAQGGANAQGSGESKDAKEDEAPKKPLLSTILKRHVTDTVLYMLKVFPFCSISHQQAILIMQSLSENYDQEDLQMLKTFVKVELDRQSRFMYPDSTNTTSGMNMGQIIQIALKIRNITQQEIDEQSSNESDPEDEEEGNGQMSMGDVSKRAEMFEWMRFCKEKIDPIDKVWQRRLEDPPSDDPDEDDEKEDITVITQPSTEEEEAKSEGLVKGILDRVPHRGRVVRKSAEEAQRLREMINTNDDDDDEKNDQEASPEDDLTPKMENAEYNQSTYWSTPEMYALDDILGDMADEDN